MYCILRGTVVIEWRNTPYYLIPGFPREVAFTTAMSWSSFLSRVASRDLIASLALLPGVLFVEPEAVAIATASGKGEKARLQISFWWVTSWRIFLGILGIAKCWVVMSALVLCLYNSVQGCDSLIATRKFSWQLLQPIIVYHIFV